MKRRDFLNSLLVGAPIAAIMPAVGLSEDTKAQKLQPNTVWVVTPSGPLSLQQLHILQKSLDELVATRLKDTGIKIIVSDHDLRWTPLSNTELG